MKSKIIIGVIALLIVGAVAAIGNTDAVYVTAGIAFFAVSIAYAEWCEKL